MSASALRDGAGLLIAALRAARRGAGRRGAFARANPDRYELGTVGHGQAGGGWARSTSGAGTAAGRDTRQVSQVENSPLLRSTRRYAVCPSRSEVLYTECSLDLVKERSERENHTLQTFRFGLRCGLGHSDLADACASLGPSWYFGRGGGAAPRSTPSSRPTSAPSRRPGAVRLSRAKL